MQSKLEINNLTLNVKLGCTAEERAKLQEITVNIVIEFGTLPEASHSDELNDTVCYAELADILNKHCDNKQFQLIEYLGMELYKKAREYIQNPANKLQLQLCKSPPIENIKGKCCFTIKG